MILEPATHDRIYRSIKEDYLAGRFRPGARIEITTIANILGCSVTPVREVLYRLVGEGLLEASPEGGFRLALPDFMALANLYAWTGQLLLSALHLTSRATIKSAMGTLRETDFGMDPISIPTATSATFEAIARASGNAEHLTSVRHANQRLHYCRLAEAQLFGDLERELRTFVRNGRIDVKMNVRRRVIAYYRRRSEQASQICLLMNESGLSP